MTKLTIQHNGNSYSWIGDNWGEREIDYLVPFVSITGRVCFRKDDTNTGCVETFHTPDQLVKLGYMELQPQEEKAEEKKGGTDCLPLITKLRAELERRIEGNGVTALLTPRGRGIRENNIELLDLLNELEDKNTITGVFDNAEDLMKHLDSLKEKEQPETDELIKENIRVMDEQDGNISTLAPEELKPTIVKVGDKTFEITIKSI